MQAMRVNQAMSMNGDSCDVEPTQASGPGVVTVELALLGGSDTAVFDAGLERRGVAAWVDAAEKALARLDSAGMIIASVLAACFAALGAVLRILGVSGSPWFDLLPRYLTLAICMFGAALAARSGGHLALDLLGRRLSPQRMRWVRLASEGIAAIVSAYLAVAAVRFVSFERDGGVLVLQVLPSWVPALLLPWGFGVTALRFWLRAATRSRVALAAVPLCVAAIAWAMPTAPLISAWVLAGGLAVGLVLGTPLFVLLGGGSLLLFAAAQLDLAVVPIEIYRLIEAPTLVTLPLFTLLGTVLAAGRAPARLIDFARAWFGWIPGGLVLASVGICAFFTTFTGASGVTILALGVLLHQLLVKDGYRDPLALGVVTASGSIGLMFAPALPLIVYGIVAKVEIDRIFVAGIAPGLLLTVTVAGVAVWLAHRHGRLRRQPFQARLALRAARGAAWELGLPVLILGSLLGGLATVVEAAAIGLVYAVVVSLVVRRDLHWRRELPRIIRDSGVMIGAVLVILAVALAFTGYLVDAEVPQHMVAWAQGYLASRWAFLLAMNVLLLIVGCLLDIFSAIIIFVPLLLPVGVAFGVDPIHLGIIFLANLEIGYLTPPVGLNLFLSSYRFGRPLPVIWRTTLPFLLALLVALMVITYVPALSLALLP